MILSLCQLLGGLILTVGAIPQIAQVIRTRSANDINHVSVLTMLTGIFLMELYAIGLLMDQKYPFFITNTASFLLQSTLAFVVIKYKFFYKKKEVEIEVQPYMGRTIRDLMRNSMESWDREEINHFVRWAEELPYGFAETIDDREKLVWDLLKKSKVNVLRMTADLGIQKVYVSRLSKRVIAKALDYEKLQINVG